MKQKFVIGIDEAGRGPLAGPVAVGVVLIPTDFDWAKLPGVGDSKALSEKKREHVYTAALELAKAGKLYWSVQLGSAKAIDTKGISMVIRECIAKGLEQVSTRQDLVFIPRQGLGINDLGVKKERENTPIDWSMVQVKLDGSLKAPSYCVNQETIIKGDSKEKVIGLASILAKVTRDRYMIKIAGKSLYTPYDFARHKGYGTVIHRRAIEAHGFSPEHRHTFCRNIKGML